MLDIILLFSVISKIVLSNCTSPLVTDDFFTAIGSPLSTLCSLVPCLYSHILCLSSETHQVKQTHRQIKKDRNRASLTSL